MPSFLHKVWLLISSFSTTVSKCWVARLKPSGKIVLVLKRLHSSTISFQ